MLRTHRRHSSAASRAMQRRSSNLQPVEGTANGESSNGTHVEQANVEVDKAPVVTGEYQENIPSTKMLHSKHYDDVDALANSFSALQFVPPSVRFGRGGRRGGLAKS